MSTSQITAEPPAQGQLTDPTNTTTAATGTPSTLQELGIERDAAVRLLQQPPDASDPTLARNAWPQVFEKVLAQDQAVSRAAELDGSAVVVCVDRPELIGEQLAVHVVRRNLANHAARYGLPTTGEHWSQLRFGHRLASVNTDRLADSSRAVEGAIVLEGDHLTTRGEIAADTLSRFRLSDGPMALWRGVIRHLDGRPVRDLSWLEDAQLAEPCLRLECYLDPLAELALLGSTYAHAKAVAVRAAKQTIALQGGALANGDWLVRVADRIPNGLRCSAESTGRGGNRPFAEELLDVVASRASASKTWWEETVSALAKSYRDGVPLLYARLARGGRGPQLTLAQSRAICGGTLLATDRAGTRPVSPAELANLLHEITGRGTGVLAVDLEQRVVVDELVDRARRTLAVTSVPGLPGRGQVLVGQAVGAPIRLEEVPVAVAMDLVRFEEERGRHPVLDEETRDVVRMLTAPVRDTGRMPNGENLFGFQRRLVAQIEATCLGAVLGSGTGSGKSPMAVECLNRWAGTLPAFRALVNVEDELVAQWLDDVLVGVPGEAAFLTQDALVRVIDRSGAVAQALAALDADAGTRPAVALCDRTTARVAARALARTVRRDSAGELIRFWDALVVDEADFLAGDSATARAIREIRRNAERALLITATPIRTAPQDLVEQVAIARDQTREVARRARARMRAMRLTSSDTARVHDAYSVVVARPTPDEVEDVMPKLGEVLVQEVPPTELERRVLRTVEARLADAYDRLAEAADAAGKLDPDTEKGRENLVALEQARRALSRIGPFAIRLACDWQAALESKSDIGQLLAIDADLAALRASGQVPTLRRINAQIVASSVANDAPVLVFCEYVGPLRLLRDELRERHGVDAGLLTGETPPAERHALCRAFRDGSSDCDALLVGPKSIRGKNLQRARRVLHIDLPTAPYRYEQRNGRAARIGSQWREIDVVVTELEGSFQRYLREVIVTRAATFAALLDGTETRSQMASQFTGLAADLKLGETATAIGYVAARLLEHRG